MWRHRDIHKTQLFLLLKQQRVLMAGNSRLKIYGTLHCRSGKRMLAANRVFFVSEQEALEAGYRPCGHCMKERYLIWKKQDGSV